MKRESHEQSSPAKTINLNASFAPKPPLQSTIKHRKQKTSFASIIEKRPDLQIQLVNEYKLSIKNH